MKGIPIFLMILLVGCAMPSGQVQEICGTWESLEPSGRGRVLTRYQFAPDKSFQLDIAFLDLDKHESYRGVYSISGANLTFCLGNKTNSATIVNLTGDTLILKKDTVIPFTRINEPQPAR